LAALDNWEQSIRQDSQFIGQWNPNASEQEQVSYFDRLKLYEGSAAIDWLKPIPMTFTRLQQGAAVWI
jgi:hypothetical protein